MSEEKCKFYKKQFLSNYCELFKQPCYGKHCNFIKEFTRLNELEQELQAAKEENEKQHELRLKSERDWDKREKQWIAEAEKAWKSQSSEYAKELEHTIRLRDEQIQTLTQQNKQMRENINNIKNLCNEDWEDMTVDKFQNQLLQALKGEE